jgi:hypothetical protein
MAAEGKRHPRALHRFEYGLALFGWNARAIDCYGRHDGFLDGLSTNYREASPSVKAFGKSAIAARSHG